MDVARYCPRSGMRLWQGDSTVTPGYWFRTEPGAEAMPEGPSPFRARSTWDADVSQPPGPGEVYSPRPAYGTGENPLGYPGTEDCGESPAFARGGIHGTDPPLVTQIDGSLACCFPGPPVVPSFYGGCRSPVVTAPGAQPYFDTSMFPPPGNVGWIQYTLIGPGPGFDSPPAIAGWTVADTLTFVGGTSGAVTAHWRWVLYRRLLDGSEPSHVVLPVTTGWPQNATFFWTTGPVFPPVLSAVEQWANIGVIDSPPGTLSPDGWLLLWDWRFPAQVPLFISWPTFGCAAQSVNSVNTCSTGVYTQAVAGPLPTWQVSHPSAAQGGGFGWTRFAGAL